MDESKPFQVQDLHGGANAKYKKKNEYKSTSLQTKIRWYLRRQLLSTMVIRSPNKIRDGVKLGHSVTVTFQKSFIMNFIFFISLVCYTKKSKSIDLQCICESGFSYDTFIW